MRVLFWFLMLAAAAVVVALAVKLNAGYALLVAPPVPNQVPVPAVRLRPAEAIMKR